MISDFEEFIHLKIHRVLTEFWDQRYATIIDNGILQFAKLIDEYRIKTTKYAKDPILDSGIGTLIKIYLRSTRQKYISFIQKLRSSLS